MSFELNPLGDRVVIRRAARQTKTKSGLFIPDTYEELPNEGVILAVGEGVSKLKVGDYVVLGRLAGAPVELKLEGDDEPQIYLLLSEQDIMATLVEV